MELHIGKKIQEKLKEKGISVSEFARRINTSRENVYGIFRRKTIDTGLLHKISTTLDYDFFQLYLKEDTTAKELELCKRELELLKRENENLRSEK